jgi:hypothetical protein
MTAFPQDKTALHEQSQKSKGIDMYCPQKKTVWPESAGANYTDRARPPLIGEVSANFCG